MVETIVKIAASCLLIGDALSLVALLIAYCVGFPRGGGR